VTPDQELEFLEHMRAGMRRGAAAEVMGFTRREVLDYIDSNAEFELAVLDAEGLATEHVEEALYQAAVSGSVPAAKLWLELRRPKAPPLPMVLPDDTVVGTDGDDDFEDLVKLTME
jgi:predicted methyltransferase MtxX (methanogen marker protein 4)